MIEEAPCAADANGQRWQRTDHARPAAGTGPKTSWAASTSTSSRSRWRKCCSRMTGRNAFAECEAANARKTRGNCDKTGRSPE